MFNARVLVLGLAVGVCCLLATGGIASAAQAGTPVDPRLLYECEAKAAEYTKNLGKSGDKQLYQEHLKLCLEVSEPQPVVQAKALPRPKASACASGTIPLKFVNKSGETIWIGAWGTPPRWRPRIGPNGSSNRTQAASGVRRIVSAAG